MINSNILYVIICIIILRLLNNTQEGFSEAPWQQGLSVTHYYDCGGQSCMLHCYNLLKMLIL